MSAPHVVGIAILALTSGHLAQSTPATTVTITVMDQGGAYVPSATITVQSDLAIPSNPVQTDSHGQAELIFSQCPCVVKVAAIGFKTWMKQIKVPSELEQSITVTLRVGDVGNAPLVISIQPEMPLYRPEPGFIPTQPLEALPVPATYIHTHRR